MALGVILVTWFHLPLASVGIVAIGTAIAGLLLPHEPLVAFGIAVIGLSVILSRREDEAGEWLAQTWGFAKLILPLLFAGVLVAGLLLGRPGHEGVIPSAWISRSVGASVVGAFMYFATLTEVPILQGLIGNGMGKGPALALLLAGPALSLPNMLVIRSIMGTQKTIVFVSLVVVMATVSGLLYGQLM